MTKVEVTAIFKAKLNWAQGQIWGSVAINTAEQGGHCLRTDNVTSIGDETSAIWMPNAALKNFEKNGSMWPVIEMGKCMKALTGVDLSV